METKITHPNKNLIKYKPPIKYSIENSSKLKPYNEDAS